MSDAEPTTELETDAERVMQALRPRRRARPRLAEPLREAQDLEVETTFGPVIAWRLDPWGGSRTTPATLLVHGWEDDNALWGPLIEILVEIGRPIIAFDLPGHGFSPAEECHIDAGSAAILAVAKALGPIDSVVGHSFGCVAATRALADGLAARRVVLIATPLPGERGASRRGRVQAAFGVSDAVMDRVEALTAERAKALRSFDYPALAAAMTAQVLLVHSLDDEDCPPENSRVVADAWSKAELTWTDGLGHRTVAQDAATLQGVAEFLERA